MKLRPYLKNTASLAPNLLFILIIITFTSSCGPRYSFPKKTLSQSLTDICAKDNITVKAELVGKSLWVYAPFDSLVEEKEIPEQPEKKEMLLTDISSYFEHSSFKINFATGENKQDTPIEKTYPALTKTASKKIDRIITAISRVILSTDAEIDFFAVVASDIDDAGIDFFYIGAVIDIRKSSVSKISPTEYRKRIITDLRLNSEALGDKEGKHIQFTDIQMVDFLSYQILQRINNEFAYGLDKEIDLEQTITSICYYVISAYDFADFERLELSDLSTGEKLILSQRSLEEFIEKTPALKKEKLF
ncbi:MAG TPA: hypothetical protein ENH41_05595 [Candidatus Omnitrophica bacterium]|nr:hypothetical protein [Candidatus Omnitrophota bacterium]